MSEALVLVERDAGVALVTINRSRVLDALNRATIERSVAPAADLREGASAALQTRKPEFTGQQEA